LVRRGKKEAAMVSSGGAIPIGRNAKEQEIGATDISGTGLAHRTAPNDTMLQPAKDRLDPGRHQISSRTATRAPRPTPV